MYPRSGPVWIEFKNTTRRERRIGRRGGFDVSCSIERFFSFSATVCPWRAAHRHCPALNGRFFAPLRGRPSVSTSDGFMIGDRHADPGSVFELAECSSFFPNPRGVWVSSDAKRVRKSLRNNNADVQERVPRSLPPRRNEWATARNQRPAIEPRATTFTAFWSR